MEINGIPLRVPQSKKKMISLNLNCFRNACYHANHKVKDQINKIIILKCEGKVAPAPPLKLTYRIYRPTKRRADLTNIGSIVDKFVSDGLVLAGLIEDDNTDIIKCVEFIDCGVDKWNPRADLIIEKF